MPHKKTSATESDESSSVEKAEEETEEQKEGNMDAINFYEENLTDSSNDCRSYKTFNAFHLLSQTSRDSPCILGIDEAGRGPVLGPMVYACAVTPLERTDLLRSFGLADSKTLTEQKREELLHTMLNQADWVGYGVHVISPVYITEKMLDRCKTSLNTISHDAAIALIQSALDAGICLKEVYVDTVGKAEHYQDKLQRLFPSLRITVESKADDTYPIVSGASIFAKVTRDRLLQQWPIDERGSVSADLPIGSGYPGDPLTKKYLTACLDPVFGFPPMVRSSWSTATNLMDRTGICVEWEDDEDSEKVAEAKRLARKRELAKGTSKLSSFFSVESGTGEKVKPVGRQPYFSMCGLAHVDRLL